MKKATKKDPKGQVTAVNSELTGWAERGINDVKSIYLATEPLIKDVYPVIETEYHLEKEYDEGQYLGKVICPDITDELIDCIRKLKALSFKRVVLRDKNKEGHEVLYEILSDAPEKGTTSIFPKYSSDPAALDDTNWYVPMRVYKSKEVAKEEVA